MNKNEKEKRREIAKLNANALRLFERAKTIRQKIPTLTSTARDNALVEFKDLEDAAVRESLRSLELEKQLALQE